MLTAGLLPDAWLARRPQWGGASLHWSERIIVMLIRAYDLFWRADEIEWFPGSGRRGAFCMLGRIGTNAPTTRVADFRQQHGLYILYSDYGPYYVGLTRRQYLGKRLKDHLGDHHAGNWDRFSWFGFRQVLKSKDENGLCALKDMPKLSRLDRFGQSPTWKQCSSRP